MLEEAAGITGLALTPPRSRAEAESRREANLARLDDVLRTLNDQLAGAEEAGAPGRALSQPERSDPPRRGDELAISPGTRPPPPAPRPAEQLRQLPRPRSPRSPAAPRMPRPNWPTRKAHCPTCVRPKPKPPRTSGPASAWRREQLDAEEARVTAALAEIEARLRQLAADMERERASRPPMPKPPSGPPRRRTQPRSRRPTITAADTAHAKSEGRAQHRPRRRRDAGRRISRGPPKPSPRPRPSASPSPARFRS